MTTIDVASEAIAARWKAQWVAANPAITFAFEGEDDFVPPTKGYWAKLFVRQMVSQQQTMGANGNRKFIRRARVYVEIKGETGKGTKRVAELAKQAADIFEGVRFSGLRFFAALVRESGDDGKWITFLVDAPFDYHEIK